ncbi:MAG TPA: prenyltransferase/squalene oxidase repeat-containing protein [Herpetosiphonaceae bacterium]
MAIDIARAQVFVEKYGTPLERARLLGLLDPQRIDRVAPPAVAELLALQNPDGGFPFGLVAGRPSALSTTASTLYWLRDLKRSGSAEAQRALDFLSARQTPRGIWREQRSIQQFNPPLWSDPESTAADIYTTGLCAGALAVFADDDLTVDLAVNWLQTQQARDGLMAGFKAHSSWLTVPAFERIFGNEARATRRLIGGLGQILADEWPASMVAWMLQSLLDAGYTTRTALVDRAWHMLQQAQQPDGSFTGDDEEDSVVQTTLAAIDVALRFRRRGQA